MIVSSVVLWDQPQVDGRRFIRESHHDHLGREFFRDYLAEANVDASAAALAYGLTVDAVLVANELARNLGRLLADGDLATPTNEYSTAQDNATYVREFYRGATREQAVMVGSYLSTLSNAQLKAAFGLTDPQVATLRVKVDAQKATLDAIRAAEGQ